MKTHLKLKSSIFPAVYVSGDPDQFYELKDFCGGDITISYEIAPGIGGYWRIMLRNPLTNTDTVVPDGSYILKLKDDSFIAVEGVEAAKYFDDVSDTMTD